MDRGRNPTINPDGEKDLYNAHNDLLNEFPYLGLPNP